jgi:DNA-binding NarL/FixJ family response regulator
VPRAIVETSELTQAEVAILRLVDTGLSNGEIAGALSISIATVKTHLHRAFCKLNAHNRTHAVALARASDGILKLFRQSDAPLGWTGLAGDARRR